MNALAAHLEPYNEFACCKKCGAASSLIGTKYTRLMFGGDVIRRTCGRCGFIWDQRPKDAKA